MDIKRHFHMTINSKQGLFRFFLIGRFSCDQRVDYIAASKFFGVSPWTVRRWFKHQAPEMALRMAEMAHRSLPNDGGWEDFRFGRDGRLYHGNQRLSWSAGDLQAMEIKLEIAYDNKVRSQHLEKQLNAVRNEHERQAIVAELEEAIERLEKLKLAPWLARNGEHFHS